jgi:ubiquinone/menaquinone biosynthesis C-methylase UbiE
MSLRPDSGIIIDPPQSSHLSTSSSSNRAATAWTERQLNPHRAAAVAKYSGRSFLDVGCGNGRYVLHFNDQFETAGIDIQSYPQWDEVPEKFQVADAAVLPFEDASFDTVVSFETLEHVPDPEAVLSEFHRICRKNIIFSVPNCELPSSLEASRLTFFHYTDRSHVNFFTRDTLAAALRRTGFEPQNIALINACPTQPLLKELFRLPSFLTRVIGKLAKQDAFHMTILAVADKR